MTVIQEIAAQNAYYPLNFPNYSFINYNANKLVFNTNDNNFVNLFSKLDTLLYYGKGHLNILQIGASHVQADQMTGRFRENLYRFIPGLVSNRGIIFPYSMAKTNHPFNYNSTYTGKWTTCRNVENSKACNIGVTGITAITTDSIAEFNFYFKNSIYPAFRFDNIMVIHATGPCYYDIDLITDGETVCEKNIFDSYTVFKTSRLLDTLSFRVIKSDSIQESFELYGIVAGIDSAEGVTYNAIGVNGASVSSYLRCNLFKEHLALLKPDLVILSLGINDVQNKDFSATDFERNYDILINQIKKVNPDVSIILTTNSDSYYKRKHPNKNSILAKDVAYQLMKKHQNIALWDWFEVMGGIGKVKQWEKQNLVKKDLLHFTKEGYFLLGDMFFSAFINSFEDYLKVNSDD